MQASGIVFCMNATKTPYLWQTLSLSRLEFSMLYLDYSLLFSSSTTTFQNMERVLVLAVNGLAWHAGTQSPMPGQHIYSVSIPGIIPGGLNQKSRSIFRWLTKVDRGKMYCVALLKIPRHSVNKCSRCCIIHIL